MKKRNMVLLGSAAVLALTIAGSIGAVAASAATEINQDGGSASTEVTYQVKDTWTVTVPELLVVGGGNGAVEAKNVKIAPDTTLTVTVTSTNEWQVKEEGAEGTGIEYELQDATESTKIEGTVLEVEAGSAGGSKDVKAGLASGSENYSTGGESYTDTLTFEASVA